LSFVYNYYLMNKENINGENTKKRGKITTLDNDGMSKRIQRN